MTRWCEDEVEELSEDGMMEGGSGDAEAGAFSC